jgi:hypothetical protein
VIKLTDCYPELKQRPRGLRSGDYVKNDGVVYLLAWANRSRIVPVAISDGGYWGDGISFHGCPDISTTLTAEQAVEMFATCGNRLCDWEFLTLAEAAAELAKLAEQDK